MGKAKPTKHTSAELKAKEFNATVNRGGGTGGIVDRKGGTAGHSRYECKICKMAAPNPSAIQAHFESKHSKMGTFDILVHATDKHAGGASTTQGTAVLGGIKKHHN